jgi:ornithine carbamoyltransferase
MKHFLTLKDFSKEELLEMIDLGLIIKKETRQKIYKDYLHKQTLGMIFEKSSTRTRVSFETGIYQLGGVGLFLSNKDIQLGRGETISDTARVISSMVDMIMIRTFEHAKLEEFASYSRVPVINGLTDDYHPVQLMADYMTLVENGLDYTNIKACYIGDGNNMTNSWMMMAAVLGFDLTIATPEGYEVNEKILYEALELAKKSGSKIEVFNNPEDAIKGSNVVVTDTWVSMGQEEEKAQRLKDFNGFMVDEKLMSLSNNAKFLHCLPAYRDFEVSKEVLEGQNSLVFEEAENRLHAQKGIMVWLYEQMNS